MRERVCVCVREREREVQDFPGPRNRTVLICTYTKSVTGGHVIMLLTTIEVVRFTLPIY